MRFLSAIVMMVGISVLSGCGSSPVPENWVCGPIRLFNEERTILVGYRGGLWATATVGFREYREGDEDTYRVVKEDGVLIVEYFETSAGRDDAGVHHNWNNLYGVRLGRGGEVLVEYRYRLGDVGDGTREEQLKEKMADGPLAPDWELRWEPCRKEPTWRAWLGRVVTMVFSI